MSFSIIVKDGLSNEIERCWRSGNERYLIQNNGGLLSELDTTSYDVFAGQQAEQLIEELELAKLKVDDCEDLAHLDHIQELARSTVRKAGRTITFTPFELTK